MTHFTETGAKAGYPLAGYVTAPSEKMEEPVQSTTTTTTTAAVTKAGFCHWKTEKIITLKKPGFP